MKPTTLPPIHSEQVTLILDEREANQFRMFQKYHDTFCALEEKGAFKIAFGKCVMNYAFNELQNITIEQIVWKKP